MSKVVMITGTTSGIGRACAFKFASLDYDIIAHYHTKEEEAYRLKKEIEREYSVKVYCLKADFREEEEIKGMVHQIENEFSHIDVLVNNAALCIDTLYEEKTKQNFMATLEVNVVGTFLLSKMVADNCMQKGSIINITSTNGIDTYFPMCLDYDASKASLISLTHNLALQYAPHIRVNAVAPGWVSTESEMAGLDDEFLKSECEKIFVKRIGTPEEIASVVYFLASQDASYINNTVIRVDGGHYS